MTPRDQDFGSVHWKSGSPQTQVDSFHMQRAPGALRQEISFDSGEESFPPDENVWIGITANQATGIPRHTCSFVHHTFVLWKLYQHRSLRVVAEKAAFCFTLCGHISGMTHWDIRYAAGV